jgi:eukaryotic-like serine/threonine-protein kinase
MAPEQALGLTVTRRSDVFAVGIMFWEAAMGQRMWKDKDDMQIVQALVAGDLPPMPHEPPPGIARICNRALARRPEDRYTTAEEFRVDIEQYLAETGALVETRRQLAPTVTELFKDKRTEIRGIIEKQLALVQDIPPDGPTSGPPPSASQLSGLAVVAQDSTSNPNLSVTVNTPMQPMSGSGQAISRRPGEIGGDGSSRSKMPALIVVGGIMILSAAAFGMWKTSIAKPHASATPATVQSEISIRLHATPANARVVLDDRPEQPVPLDIKVPRDEQPHKVRIEADGYEPRVESISFARDSNMTIDLVRKAEPAPATTPNKRPTVAAAPAPPPPPQPWRPSAPINNKPETKTEPPPPTPPTPTAAPTPTPTAAASASGNKGRNLSLDKGDPWGPK